MLNTLAIIFLGPVILMCFAGIWVLHHITLGCVTLYKRITK